MMMEEMVGEAGGLDSMAAMMFGKAYPSTPQPPMLLGHLTALKVKLWRLLLGRGGGSGERGVHPRAVASGQWPSAAHFSSDEINTMHDVSKVVSLRP